MYSQSTMGPNRIQEHAREVAARAELQSHSLRQTSNSRSLFEQQIEQQQSLLMEQQQQSLQHFNAAIQKEMDKDTKLLGTEQEEILDPEKEMSGKITRSDSLSSVDSLEISSGLTRDSLMSSLISHPEPTTTSTEAVVSANQQTTPDHHYSNKGTLGNATSNTGHNYTQPTFINSAWGTAPSITGFGQDSRYNTPNGNYTGPSSSSVGGFVLHRSPSNPTNVAVVSPSVIQARNEPSNHENNDKPSSIQGTLDVGSFTPNKDLRNESSITGPDPDYGYGDAKNGEALAGYVDKSEASEPYNMIRTSSNGRANAHYYQDSVVNNASTFVLHHDGVHGQSGNDYKQAQQLNFDYSNPYSSKSSTTNVTVTSAYTPGAHMNQSVSTYSPANYSDASTVGKTVTASSASVIQTTLPPGFSHMTYLPHPPNVSAPTNRPAVTMADMRASSLAGNVNAKQYEQMNVTELNNGNDIETIEEEEEDPKIKQPKQKVLFVNFFPQNLKVY